jgi:small-conductance mechanosensitive channel
MLLVSSAITDLINLDTKDKMHLLSNTLTWIIGLAMVLATVVLGLILRRLLKRRLEKTVLDKWVIETLSIIVILLPVIPGIFGALAIWNLGVVSTIISIITNGDGKILITIGWRLIQSLFIAALGYGIARTIRALTIQGFGNHNHIDINIRTLFARVLYFTTLSIAAYFVLAAWDVPVGIPVAVLGAFTVTITVAFQDILKNLVAGVYILVERPVIRSM